MAKKAFFLLPALMLIFTLTACSAVQLPWSSASTSATQPGALSNFANQPVKNKLAVGLLELESSDLAITSAQAKELLPLWMAVKSLSTNSNTTPSEMAALYLQIEGVLTDSQLQAIEKLDLPTSELTALVQKYEAQTVQSNSASASSVNQTAQSALDGVGGPGADIQGVGMQDPGMGGILGGAPAAALSNTSNSSSTRVSSTASQANLNLLLADPVISLLKARLNSQGT